MQLAWATDVHLDHLHGNRLQAFLERLKVSPAEAVLLTGDIATSRKFHDGTLQIEHELLQMARFTSKKIYYVCGNHDYWYGSISHTRRKLSELNNENLVFLTTQDAPMMLNENTALIGHDCWYDAIYGDWKRSNFQMVDWVFIHDYLDVGAAWTDGGGNVRDPNFGIIVGKSRAIAVQGAEQIEMKARAAIEKGAKRVLIASHIPPFPEAHIHEGKVGDDIAQPWYTSGLLGETLLKLATDNPNTVFVSFSGHTHGSYNGQKLHNLHVHVGGARYGHPAIQTLIDIG